MEAEGEKAERNKAKNVSRKRENIKEGLRNRARRSRQTER
jgi:hypothetical protein